MDKERVTHIAGIIVYWLELFLAAMVVLAVVASLIFSTFTLLESDWRSMTTFYDAIDRILLVVIGIELVRMLIIRKLVSVLELLAFIVARKMLSPNIRSLDIVLGSVAFVILLGARYALSHYHRRINDPLPDRS